jgi:hypothetical protein
LNPTATWLLDVEFSKASLPIATLLIAVVILSKALLPTPKLFDPEVRDVNAFLPIAVLFPPETEASKAFSPRTVLLATEFAPLPMDIELKDPSVVNVGEILLPAIAALAFVLCFRYKAWLDTGILRI